MDTLRLRADRVGLRPQVQARISPLTAASRPDPAPSTTEPPSPPPVAVPSPHRAPVTPASCLARERLAATTEAWLDDRILGRAILLAGHPGTGKSTLVQSVLVEKGRYAAAHGRVVLPVSLHGPTLFRPRTVGTNPSAGANPSSDRGLADQIFKDIAEGLYQALRARVVGELECRAAADPMNRALYAEVAAWFRVDHDDPARVEILAVLRDLWERLGLLERGLLVASGGVGQGYAEIALMANLHRLHLRATGEVAASGRATGESSKENTERLTAELSPLRDLPSGWTGLVGGALTSGALFAGVPPWIVGAAALVGIGATSSLALAAEYRRSLRGSRELIYKEDDSLTSYALRVPRAVEAVRELGIYPVFVIDELDKVEHLSEQLLRALGELKQLVNERHALFVLMTDTQYFRAVRETISRDTYALEATAFGEVLFVAYPVAELLAYLDRVLVMDGPPTPRTQALRLHLSRVVLARAACHPASVERELRRITSADGTLEPMVQHIDTPRHRVELVVQLGVERILAEPGTADWLDDNPDRLQAFYDVLYLPVKRRQTGRPDFGWEPEGLAELARTLGPDAAGRELVVAFLRMSLARIGAWLAAPATLVTETMEEALAEVLRSSARLAVPSASSSEERWWWCSDRNGRPSPRRAHAGLESFGTEPDPVPMRGAPTPVETVDYDTAQDSTIDQLFAALARVGPDREELEERGVLPASPSFDSYADARGRLGAPGAQPDRALDVATAEEYARALNRWMTERVGPLLGAKAPMPADLEAWVRWCTTLPARRAG